MKSSYSVQSAPVKCFVHHVMLFLSKNLIDFDLGERINYSHNYMYLNVNKK